MEQLGFGCSKRTKTFPSVYALYIGGGVGSILLSPAYTITTTKTVKVILLLINLIPQLKVVYNYVYSEVAPLRLLRVRVRVHACSFLERTLCSIDDKQRLHACKTYIHIFHTIDIHGCFLLSNINYSVCIEVMIRKLIICYAYMYI